MKLIVLTEAGKTKGMGHYVRTSNICETCIEHGIAVEMYLDDNGEIDGLNEEYVRKVSWNNDPQLFDWISENDIVLIDSYCIELKFIAGIQEHCKETIIIDDNKRLDYSNSIILNPNHFADELHYPENKNNRYFLGKDYTLLRKEFYNTQIEQVKENVSDILITFGGTDVKNMTAKVIRYLKAKIPSANLHVVITSAYSSIEKISDLLEAEDALLIDADAKTMSRLMAKCDCAIASAGGTSNELLNMRCPAALFVVADNQEINAKFLNEHKLAMVLEESQIDKISDLFSYNKRKQLVNSINKRISNRKGTDAIIEILTENLRGRNNV